MIAIKNLTRTVIDEKLFAQVAKIVLKGENKETNEASVVFVNSGKIKELNKKYRNIDASTDVLSFAGGTDFLGEIVICPAEVKKNAKEAGDSFKKELVFVFIHGILHLLGYDHELKKEDAEKMRKKETHYLSQVNL